LGVDRRGPDRNITTETYMINALARGKVALVTAILERLA
jgi:hypothetical protein